MDSVEIWSIIALMAAGLSTLLALVFRYMSSRFDALRAEFGGQFMAMRADSAGRFDALRAEFGGQFAALRTELRSMRAEMDTRFTAVDKQLAHLDRDMQRVIERVFP
jgi:hypothetical protein